MIYILNKGVKYSTYFLGKYVHHIMVAFAHMLSHWYNKIYSECRHFLGTESHPNWGRMVKAGLPMSDPNANIGEYVFATLLVNVEGLVCKLASLMLAYHTVVHAQA